MQVMLASALSRSRHLSAPVGRYTNRTFFSLLGQAVAPVEQAVTEDAVQDETVFGAEVPSSVEQGSSAPLLMIW